MFMDGLPLEASLSRLVWFGMLWGCTAEALIMAAGCSCADPFNSPSRSYAESDDAYLSSLRLSWMARRRFDGGHFSEPIMLLRLFAFWAETMQQFSEDPGRTAYQKALNFLEERADVHPGRFQRLLLTLADLADRAKLLVPPGDLRTAQRAREDLDSLLAFLHGDDVRATRFLRTNADTLRALLAAAFCDQLLVGRRFLDQMRGPSKSKRPTGSSVSYGKSESEEALSFDHPVDETKEVLLNIDAVDLRDELDALDEESDEEEEDDEESAEEGDEEGEDEEFEDDEDDKDDDEIVSGEEESTGKRLPWKKARDEMLCAVNSLPVKGRKVHQRVMVAKLPVAADTGGVSIERLPELVQKLSGKVPQHLTRKGKLSEYAAACFRPEVVHELAVSAGPSPLRPPVLAGATPSASICYAFSMGSWLIDFDGVQMARPSSPYQLTFFLPERNTSADEEKQQLVQGVLEVRNPVGFPCHVNHGDDFFCTASKMDLLGSRTAVRTGGVTIFRAVEILFALAALCPERSFLSLRLGSGPAGMGTDESDEHITAVKLLGWELSLLGDDRAEGAGLPFDRAMEAVLAVRASIKEAMKLREDEPALQFEVGDAKPRSLQTGRLEVTPRAVLENLVDVVREAHKRFSSSIQPTMRMGEAMARGKVRKKRAKEARWAELLLSGEDTGYVDFLRPWELSRDPAVAAARRARLNSKRPQFQCPVCQEVFVRAKACQKHLKKSGHLGCKEGQSWRSLIKERCLIEAAVPVAAT
ncbi:unnamed protein product [Effrenium voratum]|nr:unnamed protein product [Effrenium voratum]